MRGLSSILESVLSRTTLTEKDYKTAALNQVRDRRGRWSLTAFYEKANTFVELRWLPATNLSPEGGLDDIVIKHRRWGITSPSWADEVASRLREVIANEI